MGALRLFVAVRLVVAAGALSPNLPRRPTPTATAEDVVAAQMDALAAGDVHRCFKFASPANKAATGPWRRFARMLAENPEYAPLVRCSRWEFVGALGVGDGVKRVDVRVYPAGGSAAPFAGPPRIDYTFGLSRQPAAADGDAAAAAVAGCWCTDSVVAARGT